MTLPPHDLNGQEPEARLRPGQGGGRVVSGEAEAEQALSAVFDTAIGQDLARRVAARGAHTRRGKRVQDPLATPEDVSGGITPDEGEAEEIGGKNSPHRRCIVTGEILPYDQMIRFVLNPEGVITPDLAGSLPGRGYWVTARSDVLARAAQSNAFTRAVRRQVSVPPHLVETVGILARRACLATLGLARRAWAVDYGYEAVRQALLNRKAGLVLVAANAPRDFVTKLESVRGETPLNTLFTTADLSGALGRDSLAFVAVAKGQWTVRMGFECGRLARLVETPGG